MSDPRELQDAERIYQLAVKRVDTALDAVPFSAKELRDAIEERNRADDHAMAVWCATYGRTRQTPIGD